MWLYGILPFHDLHVYMCVTVLVTPKSQLSVFIRLVAKLLTLHNPACPQAAPSVAQVAKQSNWRLI